VQRASDRWFGGIDPTASSKRGSGCALLDGSLRLVRVDRLSTDEQIVAFFPRETIIGIDGITGVPRGLGRCCMEDVLRCACRPVSRDEKGRLAERRLREHGFSVYPTSRDAFAKAWIRRSLALTDALRAAGMNVMEVYPHAARAVLFPRIARVKKQSRDARASLQRALRRIVSGLPSIERRVFSHDELDAVLAALTAWLAAHGETWCEGHEDEGMVYWPKDTARARLHGDRRSRDSVRTLST
jgi:predicted nuclease with RNAse H fold